MNNTLIKQNDDCELSYIPSVIIQDSLVGYMIANESGDFVDTYMTFIQRAILFENKIGGCNTTQLKLFGLKHLATGNTKDFFFCLDIDQPVNIPDLIKIPCYITRPKAFTRKMANFARRLSFLGL